MTDFFFFNLYVPVELDLIQLDLNPLIMGLASYISIFTQFMVGLMDR